jgi:hypothetical protein
VVAVNRWVVSGDGPTITDEMLALMYGQHQEGCPMCDPPIGDDALSHDHGARPA